jgi:citrate lyase beta subunit
LVIEEYLQPGERIVASCADVYATNQRLIHYTPRSKSLTFREFGYPHVNTIKLVPKARLSTMVLGFSVTLLSLLAGVGSPFQVGVAVLGVAAMSMGLLMGDRYLRITGDEKDDIVEWRLRDASRKNGKELISAVQHAMLPPVERVTNAATPEPAAAHSGAIPRSVLLVPVDRPEQVRTALSSAADVVCLDMTTAVHSTNRETARLMAWGEVTAAASSSKGVWARIGVDSFREDLDACVWPGLSGVVIAADSVERVRLIEETLSSLEEERKLLQQVGIVVALEAAAAVWAVRETLAASPRVNATVVGAHDLLETPETTALRPSYPDPVYMQGRITAGATEAGVPMIGLLGTDIAPGHLVEVLGQVVGKRLAQAAKASRDDGFIGGMTIHPEAVAQCNTAFPGFHPPLTALQPPPPLPAMWQPVVPSYFEVKPEQAAVTSTAPAVPSMVPLNNGATPQESNTWRPLAAPRLPGIPHSLSAKWRPVVPSDFKRATTPSRPQ